MKHTILSLAGAFLLTAFAQAVTVSDQAGLTLDLGADGTVSGVDLNGINQPNGTGGGFFLRQPNTSVRVPFTGTAVSTNGQLHLTLTNTLQATVNAVLTEGPGYIEVAGELENMTGTDRGLWLGFNVPVNTLGWNWGQTLSTSPVITSQDTGYESSWDNTLVPIPAVWTTNGGIALCIPPSDPCVFQLASDADGLRIQMAYGLSVDTTKFPSKAPFRFRIYSIDGTWGFRDALAKYYDWYPEYYTIDAAAMTAMDHHHDWIGVNYVPDSINPDNLVDPNSKEYMGYTKTSARIQGVPNADLITTQQGYLDAIANTTTIQHYEKNGALNSPLLVEGRAALTNSICYKSDQTFGSFGVYETDGIDFPHNCDPDLFKDAAHTNYPVFADMYLRKADEILAFSSDFASIHWDRLGGWSLFLNYRREHFAYIDHPLTFDMNGQPCIYTQLTNYELFNEFRLRASQGGLFHETAGMKDYGAGKFPESNTPAGQSRNGMFFLASVVAGGWQEGSFNAQPLGGFDFERMSVGRKAYRVSSGNIVANNIPPTLALVKRALAQTTAYGFACPVQVQYFYPADHPGYLPDYSWLTTKPGHQELWDQYEPANQAIRLAGWEPVTHAYANSASVQLQRFGRGDEIYLTVWGPNPAASVEIEIDAAALGLNTNTVFSEIVANTPMTVVPSTLGWKLTVPMEMDMTRVVRIAEPDPNVTLYPLTVNSGIGSGSYSNGQQVAIAANTLSRKSFVQWSGDTQVVDNVSAPNALVTMSTNAASLTATYVDTVHETIAVVDSTGGAVSSSALPISRIFPTTGGNVLVVNLSYKGVNNTYAVGPPTLDWVTGGGTVTQTMTRAVQTGTVSARAFSSSVYYLWNPIPDTGGTITGTLPAGYQRQVLSAYTLSGVDTNTSPMIGTNVSSSALTLTTDVTDVPVGGFAALCSANIANTAGTGFSASESGTGTVVNWFLNNVGGIGFYQGYIPELVPTTTNFSCTFGGTANWGHLVAAVFTPASMVVESAYSVWSNQYSLAQGPIGDDDGDGVKNLAEFGIGGNPTNPSDLGYFPTVGIMSGGGSNWLEYIHVRQSDTNSGLFYYLELSDNLVSNVWTTNGYTIAGSGPFTNGFDAVTNRIDTDTKDNQYIRLIIEAL